MKEYKWTAGNGSEIKVTYQAEASIVDNDVFAPVVSRVYLDGQDLGSVDIKAIKCDNPSIVAVLNGKIGLSREYIDGMKAAEYKAVDEAKDTEEIKNFLSKKAEIIENAVAVDEDYKAHTAIMNKTMGN